MVIDSTLFLFVCVRPEPGLANDRVCVATVSEKTKLAPKLKKQLLTWNWCNLHMGGGIRNNPGRQLPWEVQAL